MNCENLLALSANTMATIIILGTWSLFWKAVAVWHAARKNEQGWFIALFFINTLGILEIFYLYGVLKIKPGKLFK